MTIKLLSHSVDDSRVGFLIQNLEDCRLFAAQLARCSTIPMCIALSGTLGAGKTQWTRFFAMELGANPETISSPTFMLVHEYTSTPTIFHLDTYRVGDEEEMLELGIEEMFDAPAITIVEWADRFPRLLPSQTLRIHMEMGDEPETRNILMQATGARAKTMITNWLSLVKLEARG